MHRHFSSSKTTGLLAQTLLYVAGYLGCLALGAACAFLYLPLAPSLMPALLLTFQIVDVVAFIALLSMLLYAKGNGKYTGASQALLPWAQFAFYITAFASGFGLMPLLLQALMLPNGFALIISAVFVHFVCRFGEGLWSGRKIA